MINEISEAQCGVENLRQRGRSNRRRDYANFGRRVGRNYFKVFVPATSCCFGDKKGWRVDKRYELCDAHLPCLRKC